MQGKGIRFVITETHLHPHIRARMEQRGITLEEIQKTFNEGWDAADAKPNVLGKVKAFVYGTEWEGKFYREKEVTVYFRKTDKGITLLTAKARYGQGFSRSAVK